MNEEERLDQLIQDMEIEAVEICMNDVQGLYVRWPNGRQMIFTDPALDYRERLWTKAHELGHARTFQRPPDCGEAEIDNERAADLFAYRLLMPPRRLVRACELGIDSEEGLADFLVLRPDRIADGLDRYEAIHGEWYGVDGYWLHWHPLMIVPMHASRHMPVPAYNGSLAFAPW